MATRGAPPGRGLPLLPPEDFRTLAIGCMAQEMEAGLAAQRYGELIASAADAIAAALNELREHYPDIALDYSEDSLSKLGLALGRRNGKPLADSIIDGVGAYLGETLRVSLRGRWYVRYDPTDDRHFRASTLHFNPGVAGHAGFESDVFRVAEEAVKSRTAAALHDHYVFAKKLMENPSQMPERWNGCNCRPVFRKRS